MAVSEERQVEGSIPFISDGKCKIGKLAGSEQDNILPNAHETVTVSDEQEKEGSADNPRSPESNETPLSPPISEDKLKSEQNYSLRDVGQENWKNACPENNWNSTVNQIAPNVIRNHGETEAYNMGSRNDAHNSDEISYKDEKTKSVESDGDQKFNANLLDADSPSYLISSSENFNEFDGDILEKLNSDNLKSNIVHHHLFISSRFCVQYEKYVILIVFWRYEDPTLFRGGGNVGEFQLTDNFFKNQNLIFESSKKGRC
ncbi:unnamed protein product [Schistosoma rodhaini]|uniref:Uncharacterized protein n=1 Tax=Schistosoma rodhaini TaxID=6188 RepID=A0AA85G516_9TREM|nr:unnamed protein product [Schistosoma rodhaini]